jgi:hypothetical protein
LCEDSHGATFFWNYQKVAKNTLNHWFTVRRNANRPLKS